MQVRARVVIGTVLLVLVVVFLAGVTYQGVATALERRDFPRPGHHVNVGGLQLHIHCSGEGRPAVVLEAPAMGMSAAWGWVQPEVAARTRVCSYDRAGLGWSQTGDVPYRPENVPAQLHALLTGAGVDRPVVIAGESLGAAFARMYAAQYPSDVLGLVVLDDVTPGAPGGGDAGDVDAYARFARYSPWLARTGVLRVGRVLSSEARGIPEPAGGAMSSFLNRPDHLTRASRELSRWNDTLALAAAANVPATLPVVTVRTGNSRPGALLTNPDAARRVVRAIVELVERFSPR